MLCFHRIICVFNGRKSPVEEERDVQKLIVVLGCSICLLLTTITGIILIVYWFLKKSCILFIKIQCCFSISGAMAVFIAAQVTEENKTLFMCIMIFLETFLLIAMSTQLSKLLVVYTEIVQFPKPSSTKQTVIGIITGVPLITVFGNHIAHQTMNKTLQSWWIISGSFSFYVFMSCFVLIIMLYVFIYIMVDKKITHLLKVQHKNLGSFQQRIFLLRKSAYIFIAIVCTTCSSIAYINYIQLMYWHYEFGLISVVLGLTIFLCYIVKTETILYPDILEKMKTSKEDMLFTTGTNNHLSFYTKQDAEMESESIPHTKYISTSDSDIFEGPPMNEQPNIISFRTNSNKYSPSDFCNQEIQEVSASEKLEDYKSSPKQFRKRLSLGENIGFKSKNSPTVCFDFDLVVSFNTEERKQRSVVKPKITITADDMENTTNLSTPVITSENVSNTPHNEGTSSVYSDVKSGSCEEQSSKVNDDDDLDVMLTSISEDLDYLLNKNEMLDTTVVRDKHTNTPPVISKKQREKNETTKVPEALTDILRTHC